MKHNMRSLSLAALFAIGVVTTACTSQASAEDLFTVGTGNAYQIFDTDDVTAAPQTGTISGLNGETILGLDYRANGGGIWAVTDANNVYNINAVTFAASQVGATLDPVLAGASFALDYNPSAVGGSLFRIISGDTQNNRVIDSSTGGYFGSVEKTPVFYDTGDVTTGAPADVNAGTTPQIEGIAYDNNVLGATVTQQYGIDAALGILTTVANNDGTLNTIGSLGLTGTISNELAFDISGDTGDAFASIQLGNGEFQLYGINLESGAAEPLGSFGAGSSIRDFTIIPAAVPEPSSAVVLMMGLGAVCFRRKRSV